MYKSDIILSQSIKLSTGTMELNQDNQPVILYGSSIVFLSLPTVSVPQRGKIFGEKYREGPSKTLKDSVNTNTIINLNSLSLSG